MEGLASVDLVWPDSSIVLFEGKHVQVEVFHLGASPWSLAEEFQAGVDCGVVAEAVDVHIEGKLVPAVELVQLCHDRFERNAMKCIVWLCWLHLE